MAIMPTMLITIALTFDKGRRDREEDKEEV